MKLSKLTSALAASIAFSQTLIAAESIDPANYPKLSARQMAVVREIVDRSQQPLKDWPSTQFGFGPTADSKNLAHSDLIYQIRANASALAQAQYDKVPAYRELYQRSMDQLIQKMLDPYAWGSWYEMSRWEDGIAFEKGGGQVQPWADPFKKHNIMYSGNLFQMLGYYAMLYNDRKYDAPGALTYVWDKPTAQHVGSTYDGPKHVFKYNYAGIADALHKQYSDGNYIGIACQPKYAFTLCNEVPILAYRHYDLTHGTKFAPEIEKRFMANEQWDERTQRFMIFVNQQNRQPFFVQPEQQMAGDPIGGMMWHYPINPELVKKSYQYHRDVGLQFYAGNVREAMRDQGIGFGFFAIYAAEVGDLDTRNKIIGYADRNFEPQQSGGHFRYSIVEVPLPDAPKEKHFETWQSDGEKFGKRTVFGSQANSLMAMAQLNDGGAQSRIYNQPWTKAHFSEPYIGGVDYPRVLVSQAVYDASKDALIVRLEPGAEDVAQARFDVSQLDPKKHYVVEVDGVARGELRSGTCTSPALSWSKDKVLTINLPLPSARSIVVRSVTSA